MVKELMELSFLLEKKYSPYSKWFGTAFSHLMIAKKIETGFDPYFRSRELS